MAQVGLMSITIMLLLTARLCCRRVKPILGKSICTAFLTEVVEWESFIRCAGVGVVNYASKVVELELLFKHAKVEVVF